MPNEASFITAYNDDLEGVKLIPGHVESFSLYGKFTKIDLASGRIWYVTETPEEVDRIIKAWYTRVSV